MPATMAMMTMMMKKANPANARMIQVMSISLLRRMELSQEFRDPAVPMGPEDRLQFALVEPDAVPTGAAVDVDGLYGYQPHLAGAADAFAVPVAPRVGPRERLF